MPKRIALPFAILFLTMLGLSAQSPANADDVVVKLPDNSITEVLSLYEMLTGKRLIRDADLSGPNLTVVAPGKVSKSDAIALLESAMLLNGYTIVPMDERTVKVLGTKKSALGEGIPLYADSSALPQGEQVVSYFMLLKYASTKDAMDVFQGYVSLRKEGKIVAVPNSNALVITDNTPLIRRMINLQHLIDVPGARVVTEFITLTRADAVKVADTVNQLIEQDKKGDGAGPKVSQGFAPNSSAQVLADERTNRILIVGSESRIAYLKALVQNLDIGVSLDEPLERPLKFASAGEVLPVLQSVLGEGSDPDKAGAPAPTQPIATRQTNSNNGPVIDNSGGGPGSKPDKLRAPNEDSSPLAVTVGKVRIIADRSANKIIVIGPPESRSKALKVLDMLDQRPKQVYLATVIGQLTLDDGIEVGFDYLLKFNKLSTNGTGLGGLLRNRSGSTDLLPDPTSLITNTAIPLASGLTIYGTIADSVDIYAKALATTNKFKILSRPVVYTSNNKKAVISSGQQVPIPVSTLTSAVSTGGINPNNGAALASDIQYKDVVLKLEVIPLINSNDEVTLTIAQQNDSLLDNVTVSSNQVPVIATQELTTTITLKNKNTVVLGGLITDQKESQKSGIPLLSSIPGVGYLFSSTKKQNTRKELIVMIQPFIVNSPEDQAEANYKERSQSSMKDELDQGVVPIRKAQPVPVPQKAPTNWMPGEVRR